MGTWYAKGETGYYRYFSDNAGTAHFQWHDPSLEGSWECFEDFGEVKILYSDKTRFAIEFELNENSGGNWMLGRFCYWICDQKVGF